MIDARANLLHVMRRTVKVLAEMGIATPGVKSRFTPEQRKGLWKAFDVTARKWEPKYKTAAAKCLDHDKREIMAIVGEGQKAALRRKASIDWQKIQQDIKEYLEEAGDEYWRSTFAPLIEGIITDQGEKWASRLGVQFDVQNLRAREWFNNYELIFAQPINQTTEREIAQVMARAQAEGSSIPQIQNQLEAMFEREISGRMPDDPEFQWFTDRTPPYRTEMIARTETIRASNSGTNELYKEWGVQQHEWLSTQDDRTRGQDASDEYDHYSKWPDGPDGEVVAIDEPFMGTGEPLEYPGDPAGQPGNTINCRCTVLPVIPEEGLQPEEEPEAGEEPTVTELASYENEIRNNRTENGAVFDASGNKLFDIQGDMYSIHPTDEQREQLEGNVLTHNHPSGMPFSNEDIQFGLRYQLGEIRAVSKEYDYSLRYLWENPETSTVPEWSVDRIDTILEKLLRDKYFDMVDAGQINLFDANREAANEAIELWINSSNQFRNSFNYTRTANQ